MAGEWAQTINADRLWSSLMDLARFGGFGSGGVDRPALSGTEIEARGWLVGEARHAGLRPHTDEMANLFLRLEGADPELPPLLVGSHIDSQPTGGRFDGTYGVMAGFELLRALSAAGITPARSIEVVAWTNEEGSRFAPGMMGSAVYGGARSLAEVHAIRDADGISTGEAVKTVLAADRGIPLRGFGRPAFALIEPHIEQGPLLEAADVAVGIVSGIQGKRTFRVTLHGEENHAGTTPRAARRDALLSAAKVITELSGAFEDVGDITRFTIGRLTVWPNAPSVIPSKVEFSIDLRHPEAEVLQHMGDLIAPLVDRHAGACTGEVSELLHDAPLAFDADLRAQLSAAASRLSISSMMLASGAGHDARHLTALCPVAMLFVPCHAGISHHPAEYLAPDAAFAGARVLAEAAQTLAGG